MGAEKHPDSFSPLNIAAVAASQALENRQPRRQVAWPPPNQKSSQAGNGRGSVDQRISCFAYEHGIRRSMNHRTCPKVALSAQELQQPPPPKTANIGLHGQMRGEMRNGACLRSHCNANATSRGSTRADAHPRHMPVDRDQRAEGLVGGHEPDYLSIHVRAPSA